MTSTTEHEHDWRPTTSPMWVRCEGCQTSVLVPRKRPAPYRTPRVSAGDRLVARIDAMAGVDLPKGTKVRRTGYGSANLARGAWTWRLVHDGDNPFFSVKDRARCIGSIERVGDLVKFERLALVLEPDTADINVTEYNPADPYVIAHEEA